MEQQDSPWPLWTAASFLVATAAAWFAVHFLASNYIAWLIFLGCVWPFAALAVLYCTSLRRAERTGEGFIEVRDVGFGTVAFLTIAMGPAALEVLQLLTVQLQPQDETAWLALQIGRVLISLAILWILFVKFPRFRAAQQATLSTRYIPSLLILSLLLYLGADEKFGFLSWAVSNSIFQLNFALRLSLEFLILSLVAILALLILADTIARAFLEGLGLREKWNELKTSLDRRGSGSFSDELDNIAKAVGTFLQNVGSIIGFFVVKFVETAGETIDAIAAELKTFPVLFRLVLTPIIILGVTVVAFAPVMLLNLALPTTAAYDDWSFVGGVLVFTWIGAVTIAGIFLTWTGVKNARASFGIPAMFAILGIWTCFFAAFVLNLLGHTLLRQNLPGSYFLISFAGVWVALWAYATLEGAPQRLLIAVALLVAVGWFPLRFLFLSLPSAPFNEVLELPFTPSMTKLAGGTLSAVATTLPVADPPASNGPTPTDSWPAGRWGVYGQCDLILNVDRAGNALQVTFGAKSERLPIISESRNGVASTVWSFTRVGKVTAISNHGESLGELKSCVR